MKRIVSATEMDEALAYAREHYALQERHMIEQAGTLVYEYAAKHYAQEIQGRILVLVGPGHNGSDALVFARRAHCRGAKPVILLLRKKLVKESQELLEQVTAMGVPCWNWEDLSTAPEQPKSQKDIPQLFMHSIPAALEGDWDLIVDGLLGTGARKAASFAAEAEPAHRSSDLSLYELCTWVQKLEALVLSIDIASGGARGIQADLTISLGPLKDQLYVPESRLSNGTIIGADIDVPKAAYTQARSRYLMEWGDLELPAVEADAYKYKRGYVAIFAGSVSYSGAPQLCASVVSRSPVGMVSLFVDRPLVPLMAKVHLAEIVRQVRDFEETVLHDAVVLGPGWGNNPQLLEERIDTLRSVLRSQPRGVIDADALAVLREAFERKLIDSIDTAGKWIITPHIGEFSRMIGVDKEFILLDPERYILEVAAYYNVVVVLKSHVTWIANPQGDIRVVDGMEASLATGGSGDVLTGTIAVALARKLSAFDAASYGVLLHQKRGEELAEERGWYNAEDLAKFMFER